MANVILTFSNITNNGKPCKDPIIFITGADNVAFPCGDKVDENGQIKLTVPDSVFGERQCITGVIKCAECDSCKEEDFKICLCDELNPCEACQECVNGICVDKCPDKKCVDGKCCDCETATDCGNGYICNGCNCICPTGYKNTQGDCVECLTKAQCGPCEDCINGECVSRCAPGLICDGTECKCPPGTKYNPVTGRCDSIECTKDSECAACETCVGGQCVPIVCPDGYKCVDGECIKWPCKDVKCSNGADCGEGCGCVNGECIPCYLLNCDLSAITGVVTADLPRYPACAGALGCECNGLKCEPVDNCGQYCDGSTPCLDTNCTCYNNECVSCKNFPCDPDQCSDKYNCGCVNGDCEGGGGGDGGCNDSLKLTKESVCNDNGCAVVAKFTSEKGCKCDPIEFRTKHQALEGPTGGPAEANDVILNLAVAMFKNNKPYANFLNEITMGDDELVSATIQTVITHRVNGAIVTPPVTAVGTVIVDGSNKIANIKIGTINVAKTFNQSGTKVTVQLRAVGLKVPNNGCTSYEDSVIAEYELDYTTNTATQLTQNRINGEYKTDISNKVNDNASARVPLFVWSKSNSSSFSNSKFNNASGVYAQSGWFRKEYGQFANGAWTDKINNPAKQTAGGQTNELWNNYNYRVTVDCGCKQNFDTLQNLVFCCTDKVLPVLTNCNRTLNIDKFSVCSVNSYLGASTATYNIPKEAQTYFWLVINNGEYEKKLRTEGGNLTTAMPAYTHNKPITSLRIEQRYEGTPLVSVACEKEYTYESISPEYDLTKECGKIVVKNRLGNPPILSVNVKEGTTSYPFASSQSGTVWTLENNVIKKNGTYTVEVSFQGGCIRVEDVVITCQASIKAFATPDIFARKDCGNGENPQISVETVQGFTSNVEFSLSTNPAFYKGTFNPTTGQSSYTFSGTYGAGEYLITAKEGTTTATATVVIKPLKKPIVQVERICPPNINGEIKVSNLVTNSVWQVYGPIDQNLPTSLYQYNGTQYTATTGEIKIQINPTKNGKYEIRFLSEPGNSTEKSCTETLFPIVGTGGAVSPKIVLLTGEATDVEACAGQPIQFRIDDGGANLTYKVSNITSGTGTSGKVYPVALPQPTDPPLTVLQASTQASPNWAYLFTDIPLATIPTSCPGGSGCPALSLNINEFNAPSCNQITPTSLYVKLKPTPKILDIKQKCNVQNGNPAQFNVDVIVNYQQICSTSDVLKVTAKNSAGTVTELAYVGTDSPGQFKFSTDAGSRCSTTPSFPGPFIGVGIYDFEVYFTNGCVVRANKSFNTCSPGFGSCPPQESVEINIAANPQSPTCSNNENVQLAFQYSTGLGSLTGKQYTWYVGSNGNFVPAALIGDPNPGTVGPNNSIPVLDTVSQPSTEEYKLTISEGGSCIYDSNIIQVYSIGTPISSDIFGPGAQGDTTPVLTNTTYSYYVTAVSNATYAWTLTNNNGTVNIGTNTNTVQISNFISGPNIIGVTITTSNGCSESGSVSINVGGNCGGTSVNINLKSPSNPTCSDIQGAAGPIPSGYNISSYEWRVSYDGGTTYTTLQSGTSSPIVDFDTSVITAGATNAKIVLRVVLGGIGSCPPIESLPLNYSRCANGCNCTYNIEAIDPTTGSTSLSTWVVTYGTSSTGLKASYRKLITKQCPDLPLTTISNTVETSNLGTNSFTIATANPSIFPITSMDVIVSGAPVTLAIPSSYNLGNPQTQLPKLVEFLNANVPGAGTFSVEGSFVKHKILQANTGGFDVNGTYTANGVPTNYRLEDDGGTGFLLTNEPISPSCGSVTHAKIYSSGPSTNNSNYTYTYNSLTFIGSHTVNPISNRNDHNPTIICNGCN